LIYPDPKPQTPRDSPYKKWIKTQPCLNCGKTPAGDPHHYQEVGGGCGVGMKVSDLWCVPLCRLCHTAAQNDKCFLSATKDIEGQEPDDRWVLVAIIKYHDRYFTEEKAWIAKEKT